MIDPTRQEQFVGKVVEQISGTMMVRLASTGSGMRMAEKQRALKASESRAPSIYPQGTPSWTRVKHTSGSYTAYGAT